MKTKHSPGPWSTDEKLVYCPCGNPVARILDRGSDVEGFAPSNARLIAAAPNMLKALRFALQQLEGVKPRSGCHSGSIKADIEIVREAIAAATKE